MVVKKVTKCQCNPAAGLFGLILLAVGFYFIVMGFLMQISNASIQFFWNWWAMLYYLIGFLLLALGKFSKHRACSHCEMHGHYK